jgi:hypothetical protein
MSFSEFAATETGAFVDRLLTQRSQESLQSFVAFRQALEEVTRTIERWARVDASAETADLASRLAGEASSEARNEASRGLQDAMATIESLQARIRALESQAAERDARFQAAEDQRRVATNQLSAVTAQVTALKNASTEQERARHELQARLDSALGTESTLRHRIAESELEIARARTEVRNSKFGSAPVDHVHAGIAQLDAARTAQDLLAAVAGSLGREFGRVAVFGVRGKRLEGVLQLGFEPTHDISKLVMSLSSTSLLTKSIASDQIETRAGAEIDAGIRKMFGGSPQTIVAMPLSIAGEPLAVVYADDAGEQPRESLGADAGVKVAEVLRRHAILCLEKHASQPERLDELTAYATLLLGETEYMYTADVESGYQGEDLLSRLEGNLRSGRLFFARRASLEAPAGAGIFETRLNELIAERSETPFGRDLASVVRRSRRSATSASVSQTAEAV